MYKSRDNLSPSCSSSEELVAYLYGELAAAEQSAFEDHLATCDVCTAEFAELSLARLGVYEWRRDEFAELATPPIVIPYGEAVTVSWLDAVRAFLASPAQWATAGGAFAVLAILAGVWFMAPKSTDTDIVRDIGPTSSPIAVSNKPSEVKQAAEEPSGSGDIQRRTTVEQEPGAEEPKVVKAAVPSSRNAKNPAPRPVKSEKNAPQSVQAKRPVGAPRLNDFEDEDDNTLRLGDLLAEVDTRD
jgi:hypothetical protein